MPSWLVDDPTFVYVILAALAVILGVAWWRTKQGKILIAALSRDRLDRAASGCSAITP